MSFKMPFLASHYGICDLFLFIPKIPSIYLTVIFNDLYLSKPCSSRSITGPYSSLYSYLGVAQWGTELMQEQGMGTPWCSY